MEEEVREVSPKQLKKVAGGTDYGTKYYYDYVNLVKKVLGAAMQHGYRRACCPKCGATLELLRRKDLSDLETEAAGQQGKLMCHSCRQISDPEDWVINSFN